jgi:hypothetical protein
MNGDIYGVFLMDFILKVAYFFAWPIQSQGIPFAALVLWLVFLLTSLKCKNIKIACLSNIDFLNIKIAYLLNVCLLFVMYCLYSISPYSGIGSMGRTRALLNSLNHLENVAREYHEINGLWQYQTDVNVFEELSNEAFQFAQIVSPRVIDLFGDLWRYEQNHVISLDTVPSDILPLNTLRFAVIAIEDDALLYGYALKESPNYLRIQRTLEQEIKNSKDIKYKLSNGEPFAVNNDNFCVFIKVYPNDLTQSPEKTFGKSLGPCKAIAY